MLRVRLIACSVSEFQGDHLFIGGGDNLACFGDDGAGRAVWLGLIDADILEEAVVDFINEEHIVSESLDKGSCLENADRVFNADFLEEFPLQKMGFGKETIGQGDGGYAQDQAEYHDGKSEFEKSDAARLHGHNFPIGRKAPKDHRRAC